MIMCFPVCYPPVSLLFHFLFLQGFLFLVMNMNLKCYLCTHINYLEVSGLPLEVLIKIKMFLEMLLLNYLYKTQLEWLLGLFLTA